MVPADADDINGVLTFVSAKKSLGKLVVGLATNDNLDQYFVNHLSFKSLY
jgi:hypothetical protein